MVVSIRGVRHGKLYEELALWEPEEEELEQIEGEVEGDAEVQVEAEA
jgi:hypothetical protein